MSRKASGEDVHAVRVCSGSCPWASSGSPAAGNLHDDRAGKREEVLTSDAMWMCTSCYNCIVRCRAACDHPHHARLAHYAKRLGLVPQTSPPQVRPADVDNLVKKGGSTSSSSACRCTS